MANTDRPRGFSPIGEIKKTLLVVAGANCFPGDFVKLLSDGKVDPAAAGNTIYGLCLQKAVDGDRMLISVDPEQSYVGQASASEIDAQTDIGQQVDILATAGDTTYDTSRQEIDSSTIGAGALQLMILDIQQRPDNAGGAQADVIVKINEHQFYGQDAVAGV